MQDRPGTAREGPGVKPRFARLSPYIGLIAIVLLTLAALEAFRLARFYSQVSASRQDLLSLETTLDLSSLQDSEADIEAKRSTLANANRRLRSARAYIESDPLVFAASPLPVVGKQVRGLK